MAPSDVFSFRTRPEATRRALGTKQRPPARSGPVILGTGRGRADDDLALTTAASLSKTLRGRLAVQTVIADPDPAAEAAASDRLSEHVAQHLGTPDAAQLIVATCPDHFTDTEHGTAVCIIESALDADAAMVVTAARDRRRGRLSSGSSVTSHLLRHAPCPVLIATGTATGTEPGRAYDKVVVAIDFSAVSARCVAAALQAAPAAEIVLLHVAGPNGGAMHSEKAALIGLAEALINDVRRDAPDGAANASLRVRMEEGDAKDTLVSAVKEERPDLLVLGTKGRTGLSRVLLGSVAARFIAAPPCDLLVLRSQGDSSHP